MQIKKCKKITFFEMQFCLIFQDIIMRMWWNGRHDGLRSRCREAWEFESLHPHQL